MPRHVRRRDGAREKKRRKKGTLPNRPLGGDCGGGWREHQGGVGLEDDAIGSLILANVAEIKGKAAGRGGRNAEDKARRGEAFWMLGKRRDEEAKMEVE